MNLSGWLTHGRDHKEDGEDHTIYREYFAHTLLTHGFYFVTLSLLITLHTFLRSDRSIDGAFGYSQSQPAKERE